MASGAPMSLLERGRNRALPGKQRKRGPSRPVLVVDGDGEGSASATTAPFANGDGSRGAEDPAAVQCRDVFAEVELDAKEGPPQESPQQGSPLQGSPLQESRQRSLSGPHFSLLSGGSPGRVENRKNSRFGHSRLLATSQKIASITRFANGRGRGEQGPLAKHRRSTMAPRPKGVAGGGALPIAQKSTLRMMDYSLADRKSPGAGTAAGAAARARSVTRSPRSKSCARAGTGPEQGNQWFPAEDTVNRRVALATTTHGNAGSQGGKKSIHGGSVVRKEQNSPGIISPFNAAHIIWDLFVSFLLLVTLVTLPLGMAFETVSSDIYWFNFVVDCIFILDIIKSFSTGYVDSDDIEVMDRYSVTKNYLLGWFMPDLFSSIPIEFILKTMGADSGDDQLLGRSSKALKMLRLLRMAKLLRLMRVSRVFVYLRYARRLVEDKLKIPLSDATIKLSRLFLAYLMFAHWIACIFFMVCRLYDFPSNSWAYKILHLSEGEQYSWALFKALYNMIGGEEIMTSGFEASCPEIRGDSWCTLESWLTLLCLYAGNIFYALVISEFSVIVLSMDRAGRMYSEKVEEVNEYMRSKQLSPMLREQVREYYTIAFQDRKLFDEASIMKELSPALRMRILEENRKDLFNRVPFLRSAHPERQHFSAMLSTRLSPLCCLEKEFIFEEVRC